MATTKEDIERVSNDFIEFCKRFGGEVSKKEYKTANIIYCDFPEEVMIEKISLRDNKIIFSIKRKWEDELHRQLAKIFDSPIDIEIEAIGNSGVYKKIKENESVSVVELNRKALQKVEGDMNMRRFIATVSDISTFVEVF